MADKKSMDIREGERGDQSTFKRIFSESKTVGWRFCLHLFLDIQIEDLVETG
jgi:hypothetical protein